MNAPDDLARRDGDTRLEGLAPAPPSRVDGRRPATPGAPSREGRGLEARRDRTPSPARRDPRDSGRCSEPAAVVATPVPRARSIDLPNPRRRIDPRWYQIAMLSALLAYGVLGLHFGIGAAHIAAVIGAALATQYACSRIWRLPAFDPLSALISGIGLCTLLRTNGVALAALAAVLAIASKFVLRWRGKHLYNPTNLALVVVLITGSGWISPGQYGHLAFVALLMVCIGLTVVTRAARSDVTLAFLGTYAAILFGRSLWLGEPLTIPIHRLQSGLLLQFAFNMISDPKTTPDSRTGRLLFGSLVALGAGIVQFKLFRTNGPVWSLAIVTLAVPVIDRLLPGPRYQWKPSLATVGGVAAGTTGTVVAGIHPNGRAGPVPRSDSVSRGPATAAL